VKKRVMRKARLDEISLVDRPAQVGAKVVMRKRDFSAQQREDLADSGKAMPDGSYPIATEQDLKNAIQAIGRAKDRAAVVAHIKTRARALGLSELVPDSFGKSDIPQGSAGSLNTGQPSGSSQAADGGNLETHMTPEEKAAFEKAAQEKLEAMQKRAERAEKLAQLSDSQKSLFAKMDEKEQDAFLGLTPEARETEVRKSLEANPIVYEGPSGAFRKSDDPRLVAMAKKADTADAARAEAEKLAKRETLAKRVKDEIPALVGDEETKIAVLSAVDTLGEKAVALLKAANAAAADLLQRKGVQGEPKTGSSDEVIEAIAKRLKNENPKLTDAKAYRLALETPEGLKAYASRS